MAFTNTGHYYNVSGSVRDNYYTGCAFNSGDTLVVGMNAILKVNIDAPGTTGDVTYTSANSTPAPGQCTITLTTPGASPVTGLNIQVLGQ
jgi:hypothetical protein